MLSTKFKRSVATLGVVAGVLAAAGPASAQIGPGTMGVIAPDNDPNQLSTNQLIEATFVRGDAQDTQASRTGSANNLRGEAIDIIP